MSINSIINRRIATKTILLGASSIAITPASIFQNIQQMNKRIIPGTSEEIPIIGLGTWQTFDVGNSQREREPLKEVLRILTQHGGSVIDSSPMYGRSEKVVGDLTTELRLKGTIFEATKVWINGQKNGIDQMNQSFDLMQVNQMDLMQIHNLVDWQMHLKTLQKWKEEGKIKYIGITHYNSSGYAECEKIIKTEKIDFLQINYNLAVRGAAKKLLPLAKDKGIAVLINRPYAGGSLFRSVKNTALPEWASEFDANSWGQFFLKFILSNEAVHCVIPGTSKAKHMLDNVQAGFGKMPNKSHLKKMVELITS